MRRYKPLSHNDLHLITCSNRSLTILLVTSSVFTTHVLHNCPKTRGKFFFFFFFFVRRKRSTPTTQFRLHQLNQPTTLDRQHHSGIRRHWIVHITLYLATLNRRSSPGVRRRWIVNATRHRTTLDRPCQFVSDDLESSPRIHSLTC